MSTVLIVDDDNSARQTLAAMLEGERHTLQMAKSGLDAIQMAHELQPDLILLDIMMPGMDGFETCRRIRSTPSLAEVPIVILTALDDQASLLRGIEAGADDFLTKPVDRQELKARVRTITRLNRYHTLLQQRRDLQQMAQNVLSAQEQERLRISRELHDDLGQALVAHILEIRQIQSDLSAPPETLFERLQNLYDRTSEISGKIHRIAEALRSPALDTLGLKIALQTYCAEFTRLTGVPVIFEIDEEIPTLPDLVNIALYRVVQEALTNVIKHAQASQVWVELMLEDEMITLTIQDNGHGFSTPDSSSGIGLKGLRERLAIAGGRIHVNSNPGHGTVLVAQLPMPGGAMLNEAG